VRLIQHDEGVSSQIGVYKTLSQQHSVCHVLDVSLRTCTVFKTYGVAYLEDAVKYHINNPQKVHYTQSFKKISHNL